MKRKLIVWFFVNTVVSSYLFVHSYTSGVPEYLKYPVKLFLFGFITFHFISYSCIISSYKFAKMFSGEPFLNQVFKVVPFTIMVSFIALSITILMQFILNTIYMEISNEEFFIRIKRVLLPAFFQTAFITFIISVITTRIEYLEYEKEHYKEIIENLSRFSLQTADSIENKNSYISIKEKESTYLIPFQEMVYISAHGPNTVIHTEVKEYKTFMTMIELEESIPKELFLRIHKSFILNLTKLSHIEYYKGGSYLAYLKDNESSTLPVGRTYAPVLKERIKS